MNKNAILATKTKMDVIGIFPLDGDGGGPPDPWHVVWSITNKTDLFLSQVWLLG